MNISLLLHGSSWMKSTVVVGNSSGYFQLPDQDDVPQVVGDSDEDIQKLKDENLQLKIELRESKSKMDDLNDIIEDLEKQITDLNVILMEQVKIIYEWVVSR